MKNCQKNETEKEVSRLVKVFFLFSAVALIIFGVWSLIFVLIEPGAVDMIIKAILSGFMAYLIFGVGFIFTSSTYHRDYKLIIFSLPLVMTVTGTVLGFWISYQEITVGLTTGVKIFVLALAFLAPVMALMQEKALAIRPRGIIYLISLGNLLLSGLIYYIIFRSILG